MARGVRRHLSFANVASFTALVFAMGGSAYALTIPRNSVGSAQIKKNGVRNSDIRRSAVTASKVKNRSLLGVDFALGQLPAGPRGLQGIQGSRGLQGIQGPRGGFGAITVQHEQFNVPDSTGTAGLQVPCPAGTKIVGGGTFLERSGTMPTPADDVQLIASRPFNTAPTPTNTEPPADGDTFDSWRVVYRNPGPGGTAIAHAYAVCAQT